MPSSGTTAACFFALLQLRLRQLVQYKAELLCEVVMPLLFCTTTLLLWVAIPAMHGDEGQFVAYNTSLALYRDVHLNVTCSNFGGDRAIEGLPSCDVLRAQRQRVMCDGDESRLPVKGLCFVQPGQNMPANTSNNSGSVDVSSNGGGSGAGGDSSASAPPTPTVTTPLAAVQVWLDMYETQLYAPPSLDAVIVFQWLAMKAPANDYFVNLVRGAGMWNSKWNAILNSGLIFFCGDNVSGVVQHFARTSRYFRYVYGGTFATLRQAQTQVLDNSRNWAIIDVKSMRPYAFDVDVYTNASSLPPLRFTINTTYGGGGNATHGDAVYAVSGVLAMQQTLYEYYLQYVINSTPVESDSAARTPGDDAGGGGGGSGVNATSLRQTLATATSHFFASAGYDNWTVQSMFVTAPHVPEFIITFGFLFPVVVVACRLAREKEVRIHEAMLIMGVGKVSLYTTWYLVSILPGLVTAFVLSILLKVTYLTHNSVLLTFFVAVLYVLAYVFMAACIAACFNRSRNVLIITPALYMLTSAFESLLRETTATLIYVLSIFPPTAFNVALHTLFENDLRGGFTRHAWSSGIDRVQMRYTVATMGLNIVVYALLMLYLDAVLPKEWGTRRHPLFFVRDPLRRLCGSSAQSRHSAGGGGEDGRYPDGVFEEEEDDDDDDTNDDGDDDGRSRRCSVRMVGLRKQYRRNGKPFLAVNNFYWRLREGEIAVLLGHNGAGKTTLMSMLTGMTSPDAGDCFIYGHSVREELSRARQLIGFCPQHNILWPELTCREHLEYYAAIKGLRGSVLQESVQAMLREVDLLDKIDYPSRALSGGQKRKLSIAIAFVGRSPLVFLDEPTAGMDVAARRFTWELLKRMARSHTILLSTHYMDEADLLGDTVAIMNHGRLQCCGSNHFLKARLGAGYCLTVIVNNDLLLSSVHAVVLRVKPNATVLFCTSLQIVYELPHTDTYSIQCLIHELQCLSEEAGVCTFSISATTLEEVFLQLSMSKHAEEEGEDAAQSPASLRERGRAVWECSLMTGTAAMAWSQFKAMLRKRWLNGLRDRRTQFFQLICPIICVTMTVLLVAVKAAIVRRISASRAAYPVAVSLDVCNCDEALGNPLQAFGFALRTPVVANALDLSWYEVDRIAAYSTQHVGGMYCRDTNMRALTSAENNVVHLTNLTAPHQAPVNLQFYYSNLASQLSGVVHQLSLGINSLFDDGRNERTVDTYNDIIVGAIIMLPFTFLPSNPVAWVVKERECRARHLQRIAGLMFYVYWLSNYVYDVASYIVTSALVVYMLVLINYENLISADHIGPFTVLLLSYGLCSTAMSYALSFFFHEHSSAQGSIMAFTFASGFILVMLTMSLQYLALMTEIPRILRFCCRLLPGYCVGEGIVNLIMLGNGQDWTLNQGQPWSINVVGWPCIYMLAELPVFLLLTLLYDHPQWRIWMRGLRYKRTADAEVISDEDSDVDDERTEVYEQEANNHNEDLVRVVDLRKVYDNGKVAIRNLTFSILPHEVFGFLGTNGAGKTTTMSILCQEFLPTSGCAYVCGYDIVTHSSEALRCIGYCPQFDATLDLLTVQDHLELYAGIRGIAYSERERVVDGIIQLCELSNYRNVLAHQLSGGNRRKLSVAIALVGGPPVVFLDEPSAGMDPVARRGLWNTIQTVSKDCSIVLTTHHLEEVEVLAHRVAIMVDGTLRCIGDKTHLKHKYGSGFEVSMRLATHAQSFDDVDAFFATRFPGSILRERHAQRVIYELPSDVRLSEVFRQLDAHATALRVADYSISQTSIEQVFLRISEEAERRRCQAEAEAEAEADEDDDGLRRKRRFRIPVH